MGRVYLVGAGPGDPELLTRKAHRLLRIAGVVMHDSLVSTEILKLIPKSAQLVDVGKRRGYRLLDQQDINSLLVSSALTHDVVVRLKGGDPLLFGRAAEEMQALRDAAVPFEIVPGISAGFGAAAAAQVSLTDRALASNLLFTTFSRSAESAGVLRRTLTADTTVVVYMPGVHYADVSRWLLEAGLPPGTPCLLISRATQPDQFSQLSTAGNLALLSPLPAPTILIVGHTVAPELNVPKSADWLGNSSQPNFAVQGTLLS